MNAPASPHTDGMNGAVVLQLKAERAAAGLTVEELADRAGVGFRSLNRYLNFERPLTLGTVEALAHALGITYETLIQRAWDEREKQA